MIFFSFLTFYVIKNNKGLIHNFETCFPAYGCLLSVIKKKLVYETFIVNEKIMLKRIKVKKIDFYLYCFISFYCLILSYVY